MSTDQSFPKTMCTVCPRHCMIAEGGLGFCRGRRCVSGTVIDDNYGKITAAALDPIEKKPLAAFYPGTRILSVGSYGCNLRCPFCQNCEISMSDGSSLRIDDITPESLCERALELIPQGNIGVAYTYNEPLIGYEFVRDTAKLVHRANMKNVVVTNGWTETATMEAVLPYTDAFNIDLKGFTDSFYKMVGGTLSVVKDNIILASKSSHVEVTTLIIPGENDTENEMTELASWLASVNPDIVLHVTRFFPCYKMQDRPPTAVQKVLSLTETAGKYLRNVKAGNI
jgi:pyruvate formate lyase activating enzyme